MPKKVVSSIIALITLFSFMGVGSSPKPSESAVVPIVMYHSVCKTGGGDYIVSPKLLEDDFAYITKLGYKAVSVNDLIAFVKGIGRLPEKPIVITFDDGFYNNLYYVLPLLEKYSLKATVSIVGSFVDNENGKVKRSPVYSYLNEKELKRLYDSGVVELANHSYAMHSLKGRKGVSKRREETAAQYKYALETDAEKCRNLIEKACGQKVNVFTYPFGSNSSDTEGIIKSLGYEAVLTCAEGTNRLTKGDEKSLYRLKRINRSARTDRKRYFDSLGVK